MEGVGTVALVELGELEHVAVEVDLQKKAVARAGRLADNAADDQAAALEGLQPIHGFVVAQVVLPQPFDLAGGIGAE